MRQFARPRHRRSLILCLLPLLIDGLTQLMGWRTSTNWLRMLTGSLAGRGWACLRIHCLTRPCVRGGRAASPIRAVAKRHFALNAKQGG
ncbi:MAG: DUF2085 domain-containing protein [Acidobacteria bacterium]|nr:DUF2085 domain-containing protein [Acidobacteriota bacterium]